MLVAILLALKMGRSSALGANKSITAQKNVKKRRGKFIKSIAIVILYIGFGLLQNLWELFQFN